MSLRARLVTSIAAVVFLVVILGGILLCWRANYSVRVEMRAALAGARGVVHQALADQGGKAAPTFLFSLVRSFDGQRHIRALLFNARHELLAGSHLASAVPTAPSWVVGLIGVNTRAVDFAVPGPAAASHMLVLQTDSANEIAEVWSQASDTFVITLLFCVATLATIYLMVGHSLRFLSAFTDALQQVADGRYQSDLPATGPPEFAAVARGFNRMVERLRAYQSRNMTLQDQIVTVQEEERAEVARDLHDEVGPHLFAVNVDADAIRKLAEQGGATEIAERAVAIGDSVMHIQRYVKAILRQLRPSTTLDFGLRVAVGELVAFWQRRHPAISFDIAIHIDDAAADRAVEDAAYRIVQESISNAIRHGQPTAILVSIAPLSESRIAIVVADDGSGLRCVPPHAGAGLAGMAERARALNGTCAVANRSEHSGVEVTACLPCRVERAMEAKQ